MRFFGVSLMLLALGTIGSSALAAPQSSCKLCRDTLKACLVNHSKDACNTEYGICMRHCKKP
jgi:hypothetical protein